MPRPLFWKFLPLCSLFLLAAGCGPQSTGDGPQDLDTDGVTSETDCDDHNADVYPGADEVCDGIDQNCNGEIDEQAIDAKTWYSDVDADGYGGAIIQISCTAPAQSVDVPGDCNDNVAGTFPGADEVCDNADQDCDGRADDNPVDGILMFEDRDHDGYGTGQGYTGCEVEPDTSGKGGDCRDNDENVYPGATEACNGIDDDCDTVIDEGFEASGTYYPDADNDGFGAASGGMEACAPPEGYVDDNSDCDDTSNGVHPDATETCNFIDDNCSGTADEGLPTNTYYADADGDGHGAAASPIASCKAPDGYVSSNDDCNDNASSAYPGAIEICNGIDDDCDTSVDEGGSLSYEDSDGDGYGNPAVSSANCPAPSGYVGNNTDCDDKDTTIHPDRAELCNFKDDNCNGVVDEGISYGQLVAGEAHAMATCSDGTIFAWGFNGSGQLGDGTYDSHNVAVPVLDLSDVVYIAAGYQHSVAVKKDGTVWAWGYNGAGQVGDGTTVSRTSPRQVTLPENAKAVAVAAGFNHSLALLSDGTVLAWGDNGYGQLGDGTNTMRKTPVPVPGLNGITQLAAGSDFSLAIDGSGHLFSFGANNYGQLGHGDTAARSTPAQVMALNDVQSVAAGQSHTLVALADGSLYSFGRNSNGQLGIPSVSGNSLVPVKVSEVANVSGVGAGFQHSLVLTSSGQLMAFGANWEGQLGIESVDSCDPSQPTALNCVKAPTVVSALVGAESVAAGYLFSVALVGDAELWSWGINTDGQLGDGTNTSHTTPAPL